MTEADRDKELARRMLSGEETAFEDFFEAAFPRLYRFALTRTGQDPQAAEEIAQAALCEAMRKLHTYRGEATLFTWLFAFCRHEVSAYYRRLRRSTPQVALVEELPEVRAALESVLSGRSCSPEETLWRKELGRLVQVALDSLPERYASALEWKYVEGVPVVEIAARLDVGAKAAESLLTRARQAFRDAFVSLAGSAPGWSSSG